jgi:adenine-specific DNA glycosylase
MTGAIEFLRKAKAICSMYPWCSQCPLNEDCNISSLEDINDPSKLVSKVMDYQIKEDKDANMC